MLHGVAKGASDKMASDMAHELRPHDVVVVSLYPGLVRTGSGAGGRRVRPEQLRRVPSSSAAPVAALAADPQASRWSGQVVVAAALAREHGFTDVDGAQPRRSRSPTSECRLVTVERLPPLRPLNASSARAPASAPASRREVGEVALPDSQCAAAALYQNLVDATLRFLIEQVGGAEGVYADEQALPENFLARRTAGNVVEMLGASSRFARRRSGCWRRSRTCAAWAAR